MPWHMSRVGLKRRAGAWPNWGRFRSPTYRRSRRCFESSPTPAPISPSPFRNGHPRISPVGERPNAEESTAIRAQLIQEIESLPEVDLQPRAIAILKTKNGLSADAKLAEEAFAARMAPSRCIVGSPGPRKNLRLRQSIQVYPKRPRHQRTPSSGQGRAPEGSKPRST
jgi:hypothetical protein